MIRSLNEEASNISQGQRQLITIARAFLADPDVLILDEATSSVDTRTEILFFFFFFFFFFLGGGGLSSKSHEQIVGKSDKFCRCSPLIYHSDADNIIVMNHGSIVETGNHDTLMAKNGFYADLYNSQFSEDAA